MAFTLLKIFQGVGETHLFYSQAVKLRHCFHWRHR